jgi:predicted GIY-YIG superfamily endonuclease
VPVVGTVYLLHFDPPLGHARHYIGWAKDAEARLAEHVAGRGGRLPAAAAAAGCSIVIARTWDGTRADERRMKRRKEHPRLCPICVQAGATHGRGVIG